MKWTTSIKIIVTVLVVSLSWYIYHLVSDDTVVVEDYVNVTDLRNTFKIEKEFNEAMARLSDKELQSAKVLTRDGDAKAKIALTFDGLPREHTLVRLLDVLEKHDAPAVFFAEGGFLSRQVVAEDTGRHDLAAQVQLPLFVGPGVFGDCFRGQVHQHDLSHVACVFGFHRHPSFFSIIP